MQSHSEAYRRSGVDVTAGYRAVELMRSHVERTLTRGAIGAVGGFGGLFEPDLSGISEPVLVSGTDGVGTKLKIAFKLNRHDTVGIDCVAMCVNDIVACGARPLFFLDYVACGKNEPERVAEIVSGVAEGCVRAGCALIGGETAEMPGFYPESEYDLAGFAVGMADKRRLLDSAETRAGDVVIALPSSGLHSNGFSLVRAALDVENADLGAYIPELGEALGDALLTPTEIYAKPVLALLDAVRPRALAHITGGGFYENIPRALPEGMRAVVERAAVKTPPIFDIVARAGKVDERDMFNTFNMGVGMTAAVAPADVDAALAALRSGGCEAYVIGEIRPGDRGVELC